MMKWMLAAALAMTIGFPVLAQEKPAEEKKTEAGKEEGKTEEKKEESTEEGRKATADDWTGINFDKPYKTKGNTWTWKTTSSFSGMNFTTYVKYEVTEVTETMAKYKMTSYDGDKKEVYSSELEYPFSEAVEPEEPTEGAEPVEVEGRVVTIKVEAGEIECLLTTYADEASKSSSKTYMHKATGILVKMESKSEGSESTMELTEYKIS